MGQVTILVGPRVVAAEGGGVRAGDEGGYEGLGVGGSDMQRFAGDLG